MADVTLQALLEAGCHFGHKSERWHPKAHEYIYTEKDGIHIIDLAKTKNGLVSAAEFIKRMASNGDELLFVGTKRQAKAIVKLEAAAVNAPYLVERWIGGFLTNWDGIHVNIAKINRLADEQARNAWKKFPKHEQSKLARYLTRLKVYYGGVLSLKKVPGALFIVDIRKEQSAVREAIRRNLPIIAICDTNADPSMISHPIPANDDAVGSISYITHVIADAYREGKELFEKQEKAAQEKVLQEQAAAREKAEKEAKERLEKAQTAAKPLTASVANDAVKTVVKPAAKVEVKKAEVKAETKAPVKAAATAKKTVTKKTV